MDREKYTTYTPTNHVFSCIKWDPSIDIHVARLVGLIFNLLIRVTGSLTLLTVHPPIVFPQIAQAIGFLLQV